MAISRDAGRLVRELSLLAAEPGDVNGFRRQANSFLKKAVGWDFAVWSTVDPPTMLLTNCLVLDIQPDPRIESLFFELEFAGEDVNQFVDLAKADRPARSLNVTTGGNPSSSRRFRELLQQINCGDELRAVFKAGGMSWGALIAYRTPSSKTFSEADTALISQVGQVIAEGLRRCLLRTAAEAPHRLDDGPGMVLLSEEGRILEASPMGERWLPLVNDHTGRSTAIRSVVAKTRMGGAVVTVPVRAQTGQWLLLHVSRTNSGAIAVIIEEARAIHLTEVISGVYGLTPRERTITECILQGWSTKEIAGRLQITTYTVQDHLKSIFEKTGVRSRGELASVIFNGHYVERRRAGSTPSPYGWYLNDELA